MIGTLARFNVKNALQRFATEKGFFANLKAYKNIEEINELAKGGNVYIISASPNVQADEDKIEWVCKYLPNINLLTNVLICRCGDNKAEYLKSKGLTIDNESYLLDDYTKNLVEWESAGGVGIKRLTKVADNSTGKWKGLAIGFLTRLRVILLHSPNGCHVPSLTAVCASS